MTEERKHYDAGQPVDRLERINVTTASQSDVLWLIAEVERLRSINTKLGNALYAMLDVREMEAEGVHYTSGSGLTWEDVEAAGRAALREAE